MVSHPQCSRPDGHVCQQPSGRPCDEQGCPVPAGTWWTRLWCPEHDAQRQDRITASLEEMTASWQR